MPKTHIYKFTWTEFGLELNSNFSFRFPTKFYSPKIYISHQLVISLYFKFVLLSKSDSSFLPRFLEKNFITSSKITNLRPIYKTHLLPFSLISFFFLVCFMYAIPGDAVCRKESRFMILTLFENCKYTQMHFKTIVFFST